MRFFDIIDYGAVGEGKIHGNGEAFCYPQKAPNTDFVRKSQTDSPARVVFFVGCRDVKVTDVTMIDPCSGWSYWFYNCDRITVSRIVIDSNMYLLNTDGIHLTSCRDATVSDCKIKCGDDGIVLRAYGPLADKPIPCERVTVTNCIIHSHCTGIRIGWQGDTVMCDAVFSNIVIRNTHTGIGIVFPNMEGRPAEHYNQTVKIQKIMFSNIVLDKILYKPIDICSFGEGTVKGIIEDITFSNITSESSLYPRFKGNSTLLLKNITVSNAKFYIGRNKELEAEYPGKTVEKYLGGGFAQYPIFGNTENLVLDNVSFTDLKGE